jgi:SPP1 gp7 family putative phage head morphogenesis protein
MTELERIDQSLRAQLDILRHSSSTEEEVLRLLEEMRKELITKLASGNLTAWGKTRINAMLKDAETTIAAYYAQVQAVLHPTYNVVAGVAASQAMAASIPSRTALESIVSNVMIDGAATKTWWSKIATDTAFKFKAAVRQGLMQGETQAQIFKRVNTVVGLAGRNSVALVHTSIMQTMNDATEATLQKNADVTPTMRHLSTLDSSTCIVCGSRDGLEWDTLTKEPVGHDLPYITPPLHFGCRCKLVGVTKLSKLINGQRASMFGPVDRKVTFNDFLGRQSPAFQNEVLGKGRAELYRSGKLTMRDLVSGTGAPLSLDKLVSKYT